MPVAMFVSGPLVSFILFVGIDGVTHGLPFAETLLPYTHFAGYFFTLQLLGVGKGWLGGLSYHPVGENITGPIFWEKCVNI